MSDKVIWISFNIFIWVAISFTLTGTILDVGFNINIFEVLRINS